MKGFFLTMVVLPAFFLFNSCVVSSFESNGDTGDTGDTGTVCDQGDSNNNENIDGWSELSPEPLWYFDAVMYCENLEEDGFTNWRLPRISELRSLVKDCPELESGGKCKISSSSLSEECNNNCYCENAGSGADKSYSTMGDMLPMWSFSYDPEDGEKAWFIDFKEGSLDQISKGDSLYFRCVRNKDSSEDSYISSDIPKPVIKAEFLNTVNGPVSYRNIIDTVELKVEDTSGIDSEKYFVVYKWEIIESPTPIGYSMPENNIINFKGTMVTPVRYSEKNKEFNASKCESECGTEPEDTKDGSYAVNFSNYRMCRQKYCEEYVSKYYKVNIKAYFMDKKTGIMSETSEVTVMPEIIPQARIIAQLTWDKGYKSRYEWDDGGDGVMVDLDIHMIKNVSLEAATFGYSPLEGVIGTNEMPKGYDFDPTNPDDEKYFRHDDCSFSDNGHWSNDISGTIAWNASLDIDNRWGGGDYTNPETIGMGSIEDKNGDGTPDDSVYSDQYLVVVNYLNCVSDYEDGVDRCRDDYSGDDSAYEVNAKLQIFIDGVEVPRPESIRKVMGETIIRPADNYSASTKDFKIKHGEWKVVSVIKWDGSLPSPETNPKYPGDGIVSDVAMTDEGITTDAKSYKTCNFPYTDAILVPIWDEQAYYDFVNAQRDPEDENSPSIGECY